MTERDVQSALNASKEPRKENVRLLPASALALVMKSTEIRGVLNELSDIANECDVASSLPILQRAKRAVIVGDPHQLRHLSFLSSHRQQVLQQKHGLEPESGDRFDYRKKSILDLVSETLPSQDRVTFLDEHYRSHPSIIAFSNSAFYGGSLRIMTEKPCDMVTSRLVLRRCTGERGPDGKNETEARTLIADVEHHVESERQLDKDLCHSLGGLSPFRSQADYISDQLAARLGIEAFRRHNLLIGTAHTFQGEERDVIFLSLAVGPKSHTGAMRFLDRADVFNVAVTRARALQYIYHSFDLDMLEEGTLLANYLLDARSSANPDARAGKGQPRPTAS
jgi:superfamily I DNA and/or RNA helicase